MQKNVKSLWVLILPIVMVSCTESNENLPSKRYLDKMLDQAVAENPKFTKDLKLDKKGMNFYYELKISLEYQKEPWVMIPFMQEGDEELNFLVLPAEEKAQGSISMEKLFSDRKYYRKR
mgnify:CR=1 FL=1